MSIPNRTRSMCVVGLILLLSSAGCSHLRVKTEVYKQTLVTSNQGAAAIHATVVLEALLEELPSEIAEAAGAEYGKYVDQLNNTYQDLLGSDSSAYAKSMFIAVKETVLPKGQSEFDEIQKTASDIKELALEGQYRDDGQLVMTANIALLNSQLELYKTKVLAEIGTMLQKNQQELEEAISDLLGPAAGGESPKKPDVSYTLSAAEVEKLFPAVQVQMENALRRRLNLGQRVMSSVEYLPLTDPNVARVVGAPDDQWAKYVNDVQATGLFGNSEFSVVMRSLGNYYLKGVIFDPSQVSQATLDTMAQTVNMVAAAYGVPVRAGSSDGEPDTQPLSIAEINGELAAIEGAEATRRARTGELFNQLLIHEAAIGAAATPDTEAANRKDDIVKHLKDTAGKLRSGK